MSGQNIVITGANRGIGLQLARKFAARLDRVYAVVRESNPELEGVDGVDVISGVDVTRAADVEQLADRLGSLDIDVLVNNAGILHFDGLDNLDFDSLQRQFEVNTLGPLRVTEALLPRVAKPGGKIAIISSRMGSVGDNDSGGMYGYRMSKAAVNMAGKSLALDLRGDGVSVIVLHPGYVATDMTNHRGTVRPADSARGLIERIDELSLASTGKFIHMSGEELPW